jgi:serine/threonine protein kinase
MSGPRQVGDWIADRFEIFEIHQGGMGVIYVVHDHLAPAGQRLVALKTLREELLFDRERCARFAAECQLWVHLGQHPHIVRARAVEEIEGKPHVLLELVTGGDLRSWIGTPRLDPVQSLRFAIQFCLGMEHAIRQGLRCHRDVKPGNLLVGEGGELKITDFGLARIRDEILALDSPDPNDPIPLVEASEPQPILWTDPRDRSANAARFDSRVTGTQTCSDARDRSEPSHNAPPIPSIVVDPGQLQSYSIDPAPLEPSADDRTFNDETRVWSTVEHLAMRAGTSGDLPLRLTRTGLLLGTVPYMAPEQFRDAKNVDVRADIYSFGIVLFEMLTSELPFKGDTRAKLGRQHAHVDPPSVAPAIAKRFAREAASIDAIVQRCLKKDPAERFPSIAELRRTLIRTMRRMDPEFDPRGSRDWPGRPHRR